MPDNVDIQETKEGYDVIVSVSKADLGENQKASNILLRAHRACVEQMTIENTAVSADEQAAKILATKTEVVAIKPDVSAVPAVPAVP